MVIVHMSTLKSVRCVVLDESFVVFEAVDIFGSLFHSAHHCPFEEVVDNGYKVASAAQRGNLHWSEIVNVHQL